MVLACNPSYLRVRRGKMALALNIWITLDNIARLDLYFLFFFVTEPLSPRLECSGLPPPRFKRFSCLCLLSIWDHRCAPPQPPIFFFVFLVEMGFTMLARVVSISWPHDPPTLVSQSSGIIGMSHHTQHLLFLLEGELATNSVSFHLSENIWFFPLFSTNSFADSRILDWQSFSSTLWICHPPAFWPHNFY